MVASILTIAITVIAGSAVFGYVNSQAGLSEQQYGQSIGSSVNFLQERFVVADINYSSSKVTVWVYNNGAIALSPVQILIYNTSRSVYLLYNATKVISYKPTSCTTTLPQSPPLESPTQLYNPATKAGLSIPIGRMQPITLTLPSCAATSFGSSGRSRTYVVSILGLYGNSVVSYQTR